MGNSDHRLSVGKGKKWDILGGFQFTVLFQEGLLEHHTLLDIGCGPLRAGRLFIPYLNRGNYSGVEPNMNLVLEACDEELGALTKLKQPIFYFNEVFDFGDGPYDYLLCHSVIGHLPISSIKQCFENASKVMHPESKFLFTFLAGDKDSGIDKWTYPEHITYQPETLANLAGECGLEMQMLHYWHPKATHTWALLQKQ
jgi:SAM-dependent methyltransferase